MEIWLSIIIGAIITGACTSIAIYATGRQIRAGMEEISKQISIHIGKAIEAIHADIKHSQDKIEREIKRDY